MENTVPVPERFMVWAPALKVPDEIVSVVALRPAERVVGPAKVKDALLT